MVVNSLYTCGLSVGKMNNSQSLYGLTEKIANFVRLSKDCPTNRQIFWLYLEIDNSCQYCAVPLLD